MVYGCLVHLFYPCEQLHCKQRLFVWVEILYVLWLHTQQLWIGATLSMWGRYTNVLVERWGLMDRPLGGESGDISSISGPSLDLLFDLLQDFLCFSSLTNGMKTFSVTHVWLNVAEGVKLGKLNTFSAFKQAWKLMTSLADSSDFVHLEIQTALLYPGTFWCECQDVVTMMCLTKLGADVWDLRRWLRSVVLLKFRHCKFCCCLPKFGWLTLRSWESNCLLGAIEGFV